MNVRAQYPRTALYAALVLVLPVVSASAAGDRGGGPTVLTIVGTNVGPIPDRGAAGCGPPAGPPLDVAFDVDAFDGTVLDAEVDLTMGPAHTWMGDLRATLIAPDAREHVLFGAVGSTTATGCGDSSDFLGPYVFSDAATPPSGGLWQAAVAAGAAAPVEAGSYFTTDPGGVGAVNPMPATSLAATFSGMTGAEASGDWVLRITDSGGGDTGAVSAAVLRLYVEPAGAVPIYVNGPLATGDTSNSGVLAPADTQWSEVQNETGVTTFSNTLAGVSGSVTATVFRIADDFTVPEGEAWTLETAVFYAYQTNFAGTESPIEQVTLRIWDGVPDAPGSTVLCGDEATNRLVSSEDSGLWRIFNSAVPAPGTTPATNRRVWASTASVPAECAGSDFFASGTYWLDWNSQIGTTTAHFAPTVTVVGARNRPGDNARQRIAGGVWQDVIDVGNPDALAPDLPQDFPFELFGTVTDTDVIFRDGFEEP